MNGLLRRPMAKVVAGIIVILLIVLGLKAFSGGGGMTVTAYFPSSAGLFKGNDVGVLGVKVGTVEKIVPDGDRVRVTLHVNGDQKIPADAGAVVVARSVATDRYVELTPVYHSGATMHDGATIPLDRTRTPVEFDEVLATINDFATKIGGNKQTADAVRRIVDSGDAALGGKGQDINKAVTNLGGAADTLAGQSDDFTATLTSLNSLAGTVKDNAAIEKQFIGQVSTASQMLADQREDFRSALRALDSAVTQVADFSVTNKAEIVKALNSSSTLMKSLTTKSDQINEVLEVLPVGLQNVELANHNGWLPAHADPLVLAPLGGALTKVCEALPLNLCETLDGTGTVAELLSGLNGLLGLGGSK
ncbi:MCE family protein [Nocardioides sp. Kera G14]|uniref:MCE family protein n=1 Tax=Nocardioides sp. Kera G14 TaxID=2884264 RepID=UPI001D12153B|nr:MCE family protein [Nocardioides sp. Kera G14]UDY22321.1 MCE family protein [Nocardioides sp. Kera G14]